MSAEEAPLFDPTTYEEGSGPAVARARRTDPEESHQAAESVTDLTAKQAAVLALIRMAPGMPDSSLIPAYRNKAYEMGWPEQSESGIRTRRSELVERGKVERAGTITLQTGRKAATWKAVSE